MNNATQNLQNFHNRLVDYYELPRKGSVHVAALIRKNTAIHLRELMQTRNELIVALEQTTFLLETVAHLRGMEHALLPIADNARAAIAKATGEQQ